MAHTLPDYTTKYKLAAIFGNIDTGELAARLESIVVHDRRGSVIWLDDFEGAVLRWRVSPGGVGAAAALSTVSSRSGIQSCVITTGNLIGDGTVIYRSLVFPNLTNTGFELAFTGNPDISYYEFSIWIYNGTRIYEGTIRIDIVQNKVFYHPIGGVDIAFINSCPINLDDYIFNVIKLVVNPVSGYYVRFILNDTTYDLSSYQMAVAGGITPPHYDVMFHPCTAVNSNEITYVDDAIVTVNEP